MLNVVIGGIVKSAVERGMLKGPVATSFPANHPQSEEAPPTSPSTLLPDWTHRHMVCASLPQTAIKKKEREEKSYLICMFEIAVNVLH